MSMRRNGLQLVAIAGVALPASAQAQWAAVRLHEAGDFRSVVLAVSATTQGGYRQPSSSSFDQAMIWQGSAGSGAPLGASGDFSVVAALLGNVQGGALNGHASIWSGTPGSRLDLHPSGALLSSVAALASNAQVGSAAYGSTDRSHAVLWHGTAQSVVDLHPLSAERSQARATYGDQQGGWAQFFMGPGQGESQHACIWSGSAASFVDLSPGAGYESQVLGMTEGEQVGWVLGPGAGEHAAIWNGSSQWRDLNPFPLGTSILYGTSGLVQVGNSSVPSGGIHAGLWFGTASSFFDLHSVLPPGYAGSSASCVYQDGNTVYIGGAASLPGGNAEAFLWIGTVPAPGAATALVLGVVLAGRRRRVSRSGF